MRIAAPWSVLAFVVALAGCGGSIREPGTVAERAVRVRADGCHPTVDRLGSGTLVGGGLVVTVAHTVAGASAIEVTTADGVTHVAQLAAIDTALDVAILRVPGRAAPTIEHGSLGPGDRGTSFAGAGEALIPYEVRRGVTLRFADVYREGSYGRAGYELAAEVDPGDSGAGLFDDEGHLAAIMFAASRVSRDRAWATAISEAEHLLASVDDHSEIAAASYRCAP